MDLRETEWYGMGWIRHMDQWWAVVNMAMNQRVTQNFGKPLSCRGTRAAYQEGFGSMEFVSVVN
jgi:hypothetical protein